MTRSFSSKEKFLLSVLLIIILGVAYYLLVQIPVTTNLQSIASEKELAETEIVTLKAKQEQLAKMKEELAEIEKKGAKTIVPAYDNLSKEMMFISSVMFNTGDWSYNITATTSGDDGIFRRNLQVFFTCQSYETACGKIEMLQNCRFLCRLGDVNMVPLRVTDYEDIYYNDDADYSITTNPLEVNVTMTFYERMDY